jgi:hypothetical protein
VLYSVLSVWLTTLSLYISSVPIMYQVHSVDSVLYKCLIFYTRYRYIHSVKLHILIMLMGSWVNSHENWRLYPRWLGSGEAAAPGSDCLVADPALTKQTDIWQCGDSIMRTIEDYDTTKKSVFCHGSHYNVKKFVVRGTWYCNQTYKWLVYIDNIATNIFCYHRQLNLL